MVEHTVQLKGAGKFLEPWENCPECEYYGLYVELGPLTEFGEGRYYQSCPMGHTIWRWRFINEISTRMSNIPT